MLFYIHIIIFRVYIYAHNFNSIWINVSGISETTVTKFIIRDTTGHKFTVRVFKLHHKVTVFTHIYSFLASQTLQFVPAKSERVWVILTKKETEQI